MSEPELERARKSNDFDGHLVHVSRQVVFVGGGADEPNLGVFLEKGRRFRPSSSGEEESVPQIEGLKRVEIPRVIREPPALHESPARAAEELLFGTFVFRRDRTARVATRTVSEGRARLSGVPVEPRKLGASRTSVWAVHESLGADLGRRAMAGKFFSGPTRTAASLECRAFVSVREHLSTPKTFPTSRAAIHRASTGYLAMNVQGRMVLGAIISIRTGNQQRTLMSRVRPSVDARDGLTARAPPRRLFHEQRQGRLRNRRVVRFKTSLTDGTLRA